MGLTFAAPLLNTIYPPRCLICGQMTEASPGLCADCWSGMAFITGAVCDCCGMPVPGETDEGDIRCDTCTASPPAWDRGRGCFLYEGAGRRIVLSLKHGDRLDTVPQLAGWLNKAGGPLVQGADIIAPVPLHWFRFFRRRYNQAAELARELARQAGKEYAPDLLVRRRATATQNGLSRADRRANLDGAIAMHRRWDQAVQDKTVLLVDDVMTSGATLAACAEACRSAGAGRIDVCVLARVAQSD